MRFSSFFGFSQTPEQVRIAPGTTPAEPRITPDSSGPTTLPAGLARTCPDLSAPVRTEITFPYRTWFLRTQAAWVLDQFHLRIWEKSRQVGATKTDSLDSVLKASPADARFDVWVTSRDDIAARLYLEDCIEWAKILNLGANYLGLLLLDHKNNFSAHVLQFANGRRIYCLSSNPNALAGKRGHVKIDEFALHADQRLLYRIAKPVTQWGGTLSIISTHRGPDTLFNQFIQEIRHKGNPMGWHLFSYPIQKAVEEGIVERINEKSGRNETGEEFLKRTRQECSSEEDWLQEYCCQPADENSAFFSYDLINGCADPALKLMTLEQLLEHYSSTDTRRASLYMGVDVGRTTNLFVIDVGEKIGDVIWDRCRIELHNRPYGEMEENLYPILALPQLKRCCMDSGGNGDQLHERARERFGWKVEGVKFNPALKEQMAFALRADFEDKKLRIVSDEKLRADLRALKKQVTASGNLKIEGQIENSHCDRTWAKALRQHAARHRISAGGMVC
jgi:phage FluMu gp28-like protein